jgi:hypothetical protein
MDSATPENSGLTPTNDDSAAPTRALSWVILRWASAGSLAILLIVFAKPIVIFYALFLLLVLIHESGHFLAGDVCGLVLINFRVGPIEFRRPTALFGRPGKWEWSGQWGHWTSGNVGMVSPTVAMSGLQWRVAACTLGGPAASIATALLVLPVAWNNDSYVGVAGKLFVVASLFLGVANLIPFTSRNLKIHSDGKALALLLFSRTHRKARLLVLTLQARMFEAHRLFCARQFEAGQLLLAGTAAELNALAGQFQDDDDRRSMTYLRDRVTNYQARLDEILAKVSAIKPL